MDRVLSQRLRVEDAERRSDPSGHVDRRVVPDDGQQVLGVSRLPVPLRQVDGEVRRVVLVAVADANAVAVAVLGEREIDLDGAKMSKHESIWLGGAHDPKPRFRDEADDASCWPDGALMAVTFEREAFPHLAEQFRRHLPLTEYFGADGWPLELPAERRRSLAGEMRLEFQIYPWIWRHWSARDWRDAERWPELFERAHGQPQLLHCETVCNR